MPLNDPREDDEDIVRMWHKRVTADMVNMKVEHAHYHYWTFNTYLNIKLK